MGQIGMPELIVILLVVIILFGAKKLPEIGSALGKAIREFKKAGKDIQDDVKDAAPKDDERKP
ncbi:MAG TPA: twin-arginine translocase TatA/TatE family subunit [Candidatus Omnitrophica bacterium]|nr:twin-arginine translocase TatA/TatE family subunit [Candidatus Omnitrophota bacterium]HCI44600.1 twin-arginine translocase TatA/TatE family subunit [Candidatus Omnitrophota bacterium]